ncbi:MAG: shikimate kinase [Bacteroidetes bacterium]|nr:shikimate kinase [Bacteroidota bacterium]
MTVFLIGFMGSGKTTFGRKLAAKLKLKFIDLDEQICISNKVESIHSLIESKGFEYFRQTESETLKSLRPENRLVSTGGGTPCYLDNIDWMKSNGTVVFLQVDEGVLLSRLKNTDLEERPLLKGLDEEGLKTFISEKLKERLPFYEQAHFTFNPVNEKMEVLVEKIEKL